MSWLSCAFLTGTRHSQNLHLRISDLSKQEMTRESDKDQFPLMKLWNLLVSDRETVLDRDQDRAWTGT